MGSRRRQTGKLVEQATRTSSSGSAGSSLWLIRYGSCLDDQLLADRLVKYTTAIEPADRTKRTDEADVPLIKYGISVVAKIYRIERCRDMGWRDHILVLAT